MNIIVGIFIGMSSALCIYALMTERERRDYTMIAKQVNELREKTKDAETSLRLATVTSYDLDDVKKALTKLIKEHTDLRAWCYGYVSYLGKPEGKNHESKEATDENE